MLALIPVFSSAWFAGVPNALRVAYIGIVYLYYGVEVGKFSREFEFELH